MSEFEAIDNTSDFLDSREIDLRIEYLQSIVDTTDEEAEEGYNNQLDEDDTLELAGLKSLKEDLEDYSPDWQYGSTLIKDSYFVEFTEDMIKDCYDLELPNFVYVDWERTARDVQMDYTSGEFNGETFWVR